MGERVEKFEAGSVTGSALDRSAFSPALSSREGNVSLSRSGFSLANCRSVRVGCALDLVDRSRVRESVGRVAIREFSIRRFVLGGSRLCPWPYDESL